MLVDYYALLNVSTEATSEEIQRAYRGLAMRYDPDRNPDPDAAFRMTAINDAYSVLSDPAGRLRYDLQRRSAKSGGDISTPVLRAAKETILRGGWNLLDDDGVNITLELKSRRVRVCFAERLTSVNLRAISRRFPGLSVVLAVEIEAPLNLALQTVVIDLMHSRRHGTDFPDDVYRGLFAAFLV